ncbi:Cadherin- member 2 [Saguinus oedipus]|uniref:Cadherin- member 2 n=1 Tax=Saguinus oedipus TaxID=9490 RepID=A0ABQ9WA52_SAGOE|nr:Cadherin- member 2 [Saguinus oedipus]
MTGPLLCSGMQYKRRGFQEASSVLGAALAHLSRKRVSQKALESSSLHPAAAAGTGAQAFWLVAEDQDNDNLTYGMSGPNAYFFTVTPPTGEVKLASPLDYETLYTFQVTISVSDGSNHRQKEMQVIVEDRNDNAPVFQNTAFSTSIDELRRALFETHGYRLSAWVVQVHSGTTLPVGSVVFSVLAQDKDTGSAGVVVYTIEKHLHRQPQGRVIPSTGDSEHLFWILANGSIILNGSLSYNNKSAFYQLELKACVSGGAGGGARDPQLWLMAAVSLQDMGGMFNNSFIVQCSVPVLLSISVVDQPDLDPQFVREFYSASVAEDAAKGTSVLKVEAVDGDKGINDPVIYSISNSTRPGWFDIGADGVIRVNGSLDREELLEEGEEVQLQVTATETHLNIHGQEAKVSTWVTVSVTDVNDHIPEFYNCSLPACTFTPEEARVNFTGYVDEHASPRIPIEDLTMVVYDPDKAGVGSNGTFLLSLGGPDAEAFSVSPERAAGSAAVQVLVRSSVLVDYERQTVMTVQVVATDSVSQNFSVAMVTIHLRDINDHRPTFPQSLYDLMVPEHSTTGYVVTSSIHVSDVDMAGLWGPSKQSCMWTVTVRNGKLLDRESQAVYYLTLQAADGGNLSSSTMLQIHLLDINDNAPMVSGSYNIFVQEEEDNVSVIIQAHDNDEPGTNNSRLLFSLLPGPYNHNFSLDPDTGLLRNLGTLDREAIDPALGGHIMLTVLVSDCGEPVLSTKVNVTISVELVLCMEP